MILREMRIYSAYLEAKADPDRHVKDLCKRFTLSRNTLYQIVRRVRYGNPGRIKSCTEKGRLQCLWVYKYEMRYLVLPKNRKAGTVLELQSIIRGMRRDKFPIVVIGRLLKKDRSTIIHHLS